VSKREKEGREEGEERVRKREGKSCFSVKRQKNIE
jgi:hypothetical protein